MSIQEKKYEVDNFTGINHEGPLANIPLQRLTATSIMEDTVVKLRRRKFREN